MNQSSPEYKSSILNKMESTETGDFRLQQLGRNLLGLDYINSVSFENVFRRFHPQRFPAPPVIGNLPNNVISFKQSNAQTRIFPPYAYPDLTPNQPSLEERRLWGMRRDGDEVLTPMDVRKKAAVEMTNQLSKASQRGEYRSILSIINERKDVDICITALIKLTEISRAQTLLRTEIQADPQFEILLGKIGTLWSSRNPGFTAERVMYMFECLVFWQRVDGTMAGEFLSYLTSYVDQLKVKEDVLMIMGLLRGELVNHPGVFVMNAGISGFLEKFVETVARAKAPQPDVLGAVALTLAIAQLKIDYFAEKLVIHITRNAQNFSSRELVYILYYLLVGHNEDGELVASASRVLTRVSLSLDTTFEDAAIACYVLPQYVPEFDKGIIKPYFEKINFAQAWKNLPPFYLSRALYGLARSVVAFVDSSVICPLESHIQDLARRHNRTCDADAVTRFLAVFTMRMESRSFIVDTLSARFFKETTQTGLAMADCLQACVTGNSILSPNEIDGIMTMGVPKLVSPKAVKNLIVKATGFAAVEKLRLLVDKFLSFRDVNVQELVNVLQSLIQRSFYHPGVCARLVSAVVTDLASSTSNQPLIPLHLLAIQALNAVDRSGHIDDAVVDILANHLASLNNISSLNNEIYIDLLAFISLRFPTLTDFKAIAAKVSTSKLPYLSPDYRWRLFLALSIFARDDATCADSIKYVTPSLAPYPYSRVDTKQIVAMLEGQQAKVTTVFNEKMTVRPELVVNGKRALIVQERPYLNVINTDERKQSVTQRLQVRYLDLCHQLDCLVCVKVDVSVFTERTVQKWISGDF
jgi:hypothetical protein